VVTNYAMLVVGDVAAPFVNRPAGSSDDAPTSFPTEASVVLPNVAADGSSDNFSAEVKASAINGKDNIVGFQGDFTFDERVVRFAEEPVESAGLTENNWNVTGNVLPGKGPTRTLRVSAFSTNFAPLNGAGTLFELKIAHVNGGAGGCPLMWAAPPDNFIFINAELESAAPSNVPGSVDPKPR
jgi:hypothetical protein